jgi:D-alanyl-lipoteichoic acid acyltransferase DltB (MBOAT superfamily)
MNNLPTLDGLISLLAYDPNRPLLFNSFPFFVLFIAFYGGYLLFLKKPNARILYLFAFSCFFYYKSSGWHLIFLLLSTAVNFGLGHAISCAVQQHLRRYYLWASIGISLGILAYFKYSLFFLNTISLVFDQNFGTVDILLPAGISFYTFQTLSYTIDIYRRQLAPLSAGAATRGDWAGAFLDFSFYVSFFPQLVAGPIVRAAEFLPQIRKPLSLDREARAKGLLLIMGGLFKKAVISDYIKVNFVDRVFDAPLLYSGLENLLAAYGYALQIYCDFSGYSDMAIGLAILLGFRLPENFRSPYRAASVTEFWRRWHISLSTWLRDYLYIPLGGNRLGRWRTYLNLMLTMLLGGLWHGANWVFVLWGALHGVGLSLERFANEKNTGDTPPAGTQPRLPFMLLLVLQAGIQIALILRALDGSLEMQALWRYSLGNVAILAAFAFALLLAKAIPAVQRPMSIWLTFNFVTFGWILFRAGAIGSTQPPLDTVAQMLGQISGAFHTAILPRVLQAYPWFFALAAIGFILHFFPKRLYLFIENQFTNSPAIIQSFVLALTIWVVVQASGAEVVSFIYFQF